MSSIENAQLRLVQTLDDLDDLRSWIGERRDFLAVDIETTGLVARKDRTRLVQFGDHGTGWALSMEHWRGAIQELVERYDRPMVAHNLLFETKMLKSEGIRFPSHLFHDTMVMAHLDNPSRRMDLKGLATIYVHRGAAAIGKGALSAAMRGGGWDWATIPYDHPAYWQYSALDTVLTAHLAGKLWPRVQHYTSQYENELGAIQVLADAEIAGMRVDFGYVARATERLQYEMASLQGRATWLKLGSDDQVRDAMQRAGAPLFKKTPAGKLSVDKEVLKFIIANYPPAAELAQLVLDFRSKQKVLTNYMLKFQALRDGDYLHPNCRTVEARTGRMSITDPPLQTLTRGRIVRDAFIPEDGCDLLTADYSQMELRVMAAISGDENLIAAFARGEDLHSWVASQVYNTAAPTKEQRDVAKNSGFAKIYGAGVETFSATARIPVDEGQAFLDRYDELFPGVPRYMERVIEQVRAAAVGKNGKLKQYGWVETQTGKRLPVESDEAYKGINYKIQGGCSEVLKAKLNELANAGLGEFIRLPVHDEIVFNVPHDIVEDVKRVILEVMPDRTSFSVPLEVEADTWTRWGRKYAKKDEAGREEAPYAELTPTDAELLEAAA